MTRGTTRTSDAALSRALMGMAEQGRRPRCGDWAEASPWLSEDAEERALASRWCAGCPIAPECRAAAQESRIRFGVWGGHDFTPRARRKVAA